MGRRFCGRGLALGAALLGAAAGASAGSLTGPIRDEGLRVEIEDVRQLPATSALPPLARVNVLREAPDGSGRIFVNDLNGPLYILAGGTLYTYLDLATALPLRTAPNIGTGFASFALHPDFASNGLFYTIHTEAVGSVAPNFEPALAHSIDQHSILTEWHASDPTANVFSGTHRELIRIAAITTNHNMGEIAFDPTAQPGDPDYGLLYIGNGDYGSIYEGQPGQLQRLDSVYGCVLRIDPLGGPFVRGGVGYDYGIPPSNPFVSVPGALGEIYAYGFRNAHRLAWDQDGTLFVSDIGQAQVEELDIVVPGGNYGWPEREGTFAIDVTTNSEVVLPLPPQDPVPYRYPVAQYDHEEGRAIAGGFPYRGTAIPELRGLFVFGDIVSGRMLYAHVDALHAADDGIPATTAPVYSLGLLRGGTPVSLLGLVRAATGRPNLARTDLRFGIDAEGELYPTTKQDGFIRRLARSCPDDLDGDGVPCEQDNCMDVSNPTQVDADEDGFGNACDADYDEDGRVGASDLSVLRRAYQSGLGDPGYDPAVDVDGDGRVGSSDFDFFRRHFGRAPGPSGLVCAGTIPCPGP